MSEEAEKKKKPKRLYTALQKIQAIELAKKEGIYAAANELGMHMNTLIRWTKNHKVIKREAIKLEQENAEALQATDSVLLVKNQQEFERKIEEFKEKALEARNVGVTKMIDLITKSDKPEHLRSVTDAVKVLNDVLDPKGEKEGDPPPTDIFQFIQNNYANMNNEKA